ncbi:methionyl-tRNA formyltransferase [Williamsoniiplasma somnilux]|uniref:Methionyl-tRNA formyltransferase n=1 Tax=Williamsoniiplasma somnilux TaxID=215578 RepID=A0A2K8P1C0_9MOLU|nr:methionyl-tRNA formyltransferase [Williamsoniiplasma somnilux]ATZ18801.1 methionyl-tRNA formyltransferase [Williamsoniiplasma somnilux]
MDKLKIVFCGTPEIGATILKKLTKMPNINVCLVITQPDKAVGRKKIITTTPVKKVALENNLKVIQPLKIGTEFEFIKNLNPDFIVTCAYGQFIPSKILEIPKIDSINLHGSLLPKYRGGAPIQYAIANGDAQTGISIMKMVKEMDAGDYYIQEAIPITLEDNAGTIFLKLADLGARMLEENIWKIANRELIPIPQNPKEVTFSKNITSEQEKIDWSKSNFQVFNQIRSLQPWPIPHTFLENERYKIGKCSITNLFLPEKIKTQKFKIGEIVFFDKEGIIVKTGEGYLKILEIQRPGKPMIDAGLAANGQFKDLQIGATFK